MMKTAMEQAIKKVSNLKSPLDTEAAKAHNNAIDMCLLFLSSTLLDEKKQIQAAYDDGWEDGYNRVYSKSGGIYYTTTFETDKH